MNSRMISIRQSVTDLDQVMQLVEKSIECYRDAVRGVREHALETCPQIASAYRLQLEQLEEQLNVQVILRSPEAAQRLREISEGLLRTLSDFSSHSVEVFRQDTSNLRDILSFLGTTAEALNSLNLARSGEFRDFGKQLEELTRVDDFTVLRRALYDCAAKLRDKIDMVSEENRTTIARLQHDVAVFRQRLDEAEMEAATDPLTGALNRRGLQRQIDMRIEVGKQFALLMFDLNEFKSINDRFGHAAGDQVLKHFAQVVKSSVRSGDVVARWGGDEFIVVFDARMDDAIARSRQIFVKLAPPLPLHVRGRTVMLAIRASSGVAEHNENETAQELFTRVDALLYANKSASKVLSAV